MRRLTQFILIAVVALVVGGCFAFPRILFFNDSGRAIVVQSALRKYEIDWGEGRGIVDGSLTDRMRISSAQGAAHYRFTYPPRSYRLVGLFRDTYVWQLEPDGKVYAVRPTVRLPARDLAEQPEGFPLVPW